MNPHIKELIDQATEVRDISQAGSRYPAQVQQQIFDKELFAQLIVKECCDILNEVDSTDRAQELIQEYFDREYNGKTTPSKSP